MNAMHITASVFINDDESGLHQDFEVWLEKLAPHEPVVLYRHNVGEDNADAYLKRQVMGRGRSWLRLLTASLILVLGNKFFMVNLTVGGKNGHWSRL